LRASRETLSALPSVVRACRSTTLARTGVSTPPPSGQPRQRASRAAQPRGRRRPAATSIARASRAIHAMQLGARSSSSRAPRPGASPSSEAAATRGDERPRDREDELHRLASTQLDSPLARSRMHGHRTTSRPASSDSTWGACLCTGCRERIACRFAAYIPRGVEEQSPGRRASPAEDRRLFGSRTARSSARSFAAATATDGDVLALPSRSRAGVRARRRDADRRRRPS
jgi:hypothetical protein